VYDGPEFIVRNVIRFYGGWWSGRPSELKPASRAPLAREIATLCSGAAILPARAEALAEALEMRLAGHLADYALEAAPEDAAVREGVAALLSMRDGRLARRAWWPRTCSMLRPLPRAKHRPATDPQSAAGPGTDAANHGSR
jgi:alkyl sulfatase BDS1-like metallo-beta-lactamase superfamily hydrolase